MIKLAVIVAAIVVMAGSAVAATPSLWWQTSKDGPNTNQDGCQTWLKMRADGPQGDDAINNRALGLAMGYLGRISVQSGMKINDSFVELAAQVDLYIKDYCGKRPYDSVPMAISTLAVDMASRGQMSYPAP